MKEGIAMKISVDIELVYENKPNNDIKDIYVSRHSRIATSKGDQTTKDELMKQIKKIVDDMYDNWDTLQSSYEGLEDIND